MSKTTNKYSPEVRERAVRMVLDNAGQHESRWSAILSISAKIGCAPQTLNEWVKKAEVDRGDRAGIRRVPQSVGQLPLAVIDGTIDTWMRPVRLFS